MADDALALMDELGWTSALVVGLSMGGMIALEVASKAPDRTKSLSLLVTTRGKFENDEINVLDSVFFGQTLSSMVQLDPDVMIASMVEGLYPKDFLDRKMEDKDSTIRVELTLFHTVGHKTGPASYLQGVIGQVLAVKTHYVSDERLAAIGKSGFPILIIGGGQDKLVPGRESKILADKIASDHVKLVMYEDGGHGLSTQYIDEVTQELMTNILLGAK